MLPLTLLRIEAALNEIELPFGWQRAVSPFRLTDLLFEGGNRFDLLVMLCVSLSGGYFTEPKLDEKLALLPVPNEVLKGEDRRNQPVGPKHY